MAWNNYDYFTSIPNILPDERIAVPPQKKKKAQNGLQVVAGEGDSARCCMCVVDRTRLVASRRERLTRPISVSLAGLGSIFRCYCYPEPGQERDRWVPTENQHHRR